MEDSSSSGQHTSVTVPRASRGKIPKKSLVHSRVFSLVDLLNEFGQSFPNLLHLDAYLYKSKYKQHRIDIIANLFGIKRPYKAVAPQPNERSCHPKSGAIRVYKETFYGGFRLPPPEFVCRLLAEAKVCPTQLMPNGWRFIYCFMVQCKKHGLEPNFSVFRYLFKFVNSSNNTGWVKIQTRSLARSCFISDSNPDSFPDWKKEWFYVFLEGDNWDHFFRPNFCKAEDGPMKYLKLGVEEEAAIAILTNDNLHHCANLISEDSLQANGLSNLGPDGNF
jgi:hypothetical protein